MNNTKRLILVGVAMMVLLLFVGCGYLPNLLLPRQELSPQPTQTPWIIVVTPTPGPLSSSPPVTGQIVDIEEQLVISAYERVSPAVVFITSRTVVMGFFGPYPQEGTGSGFVIDKEGHIVTNNHVIEGARSVEVTLSTGTKADARIVGTDPANDLAVLKIDVPAEELHPVELGTSSDLKVGQRVIAIGNPFGLDRTLTTGVISSLNRPLDLENGRRLYNVIQTDAAINPGNSGGPLLDSQGRVIGVNTAIYSPSGGSVGLGFAIPIDTVKRVIPELIAKGRYSHPWMGIRALSITPDLAQELNLSVDRGVLIIEVSRGSAADKAGLRGATHQVQVGNYLVPVGGDIIVAINDTPINSMDNLIEFLETRTTVGQTVQVTFLRDGRERTVTLTLGERPQTE
ncbi:MAG: trypsin-like peptidase domain-containing protein [Chloroflexi bacterium]|nr:trypsin-like peptidase domain-containing protein [Chloroflexota bacterium]